MSLSSKYSIQLGKVLRDGCQCTLNGCFTLFLLILVKKRQGPKGTSVLYNIEDASMRLFRIAICGFIHCFSLMEDGSVDACVDPY